MIFPFDSLMAEHREVGMALAVLLGGAFGFVLERSGFGRAPVLADQFYLRDMTVLKVMFGAIVTSMLGLVVLSGLGLADWTTIATHTASWTWIWPALFGGLLLGVGFIVSGYCPGTSVVSSASGNIDGMFALVGVVLGSLVYAEFSYLLGDFPTSGEMGHLFLYDLLGVPPVVVAVGVTVMAVGAFLAAEVAEKRFGTAAHESTRARSMGPGRLRAFGTFAALAAVALLTLFVSSAPAEATSIRLAETISAPDLVARTIDEPWTIRVLDLRSVDACAERRVPGAECVGVESLGDLGLAWSPGKRDLVLVGDDGVDSVPEPALAWPGRVLVLEGGQSAYEAYALTPPGPPDSNASAQDRDEYRRRSGLVAAMTGVKQAPPPPVAKVAAAPITGGGGGCQ